MGQCGSTLKPRSKTKASPIRSNETVADTCRELNEDVVSALCNYLPISSLKTARLVCSTWNGAALAHLKKRGWVTLDCKVSDGDKLHSFVEDIANFGPIHNLSITIRFDLGELGSSEYHAPYEFFHTCQSYQDVILNSIPSNVKALRWKLVGKEILVGFLELTAKLLQRLGPSLEVLELELDGVILEYAADYFYLPSGVSLPKLREFRDHSTYSYALAHKKFVLPFHMQLFAAAPNLEKVSIAELCKLLAPLETDDGLLPCLNSLSFSEVLWWEELNRLAGCKRRFKALTLHCLYQETYGRIGDILMVNDETLEELTLTWVSSGFKFPTCSGLKRLKCQTLRVRMKDFAFQFEEDSAKSFQRLESLTLSWEGNVCNENVSPGVVFPPESLPAFKGLRILRVPVGWKKWENMLREMFPRARLDFVN